MLKVRRETHRSPLAKANVSNGWKTDIEPQRETGHPPYMRILLILLFLSACQHVGAGGGPDPNELAAAILDAPEVAGPIDVSTSDVRSLQCRSFEEEPTEFRCHFQAREESGAWRRRSAVVAADADSWILLSLD